MASRCPDIYVAPLGEELTPSQYEVVGWHIGFTLSVDTDSLSVHLSDYPSCMLYLLLGWMPIPWNIFICGTNKTHKGMIWYAPFPGQLVKVTWVIGRFVVGFGGNLVRHQFKMYSYKETGKFGGGGGGGGLCVFDTETNTFPYLISNYNKKAIWNNNNYYLSWNHTDDNIMNIFLCASYVIVSRFTNIYTTINIITTTIINVSRFVEWRYI